VLRIAAGVFLGLLAFAAAPTVLAVLIRAATDTTRQVWVAQTLIAAILTMNVATGSTYQPLPTRDWTLTLLFAWTAHRAHARGRSIWGVSLAMCAGFFCPLWSSGYDLPDWQGLYIVFTAIALASMRALRYRNRIPSPAAHAAPAPTAAAGPPNDPA
jgi:hypothetical protein